MISEDVLKQILWIILNDTSGEEYFDRLDAIMELARNTEFKHKKKVQ